MIAQGFWNWDWAGRNGDLILDQTLQHLWLTFLAVAIGLAISFPLSVAAQRRRALYPTVAWVTGTLYTIPSLALFAFLTPFTGLTTLTAEIGLVSYTLLILVRNTVTGLRGVPADVREAASGMGYTPRQLLWRIELPLAIPAVVAGVRIATVTTIGLVTVTALIGQGGLGALMLGGFRGLYPDLAIVIGVVLSVMLAVVADLSLLAGQRWVTPWARRAGARLAAT